MKCEVPTSSLKRIVNNVAWNIGPRNSKKMGKEVYHHKNCAKEQGGILLSFLSTARLRGLSASLGREVR